MAPSQERSLLILSTVLFAASVSYTLRRIEAAKKRLRSGQSNPHQRPVNVPSDSKVGRRGIRALTPPIPYMEGFLRCLQDGCDPVSNPSGYIALCTAENKLLVNVLAQRIQQPGTGAAAFSDPTVYFYNSFLGIPRAREAIAYFIARRFLFPETPTLQPEEALHHINPSHIGFGAGLSALLNALFFLLGDEGDACLIPAPYYAAFENDMNLVAGVVPFAVQLANPTMGPTENELDLAYMEAKSQGLNPNFVLITNPHNPLGVIYHPDIIRNAVTWARKRGLQTIVDEIYALTTHKRYGHGFQSVIRILENKLGDDVHMVWSVSKDFGASGLRVGAVYSQNEAFIAGLANLNIFSGVSGPIQMVVSELLTDDDFVDMYLDASRQRLRQSYELCACKLEEMVLPFVPAEAGMFIYVDFSSLLPQKTFEWEAKLERLLIDHAHVVVSPGQGQRDRQPGMVRICYSWVTPDVLEIAMERISRIVAKIRRMDWADLNETTLSGIIL